jgi:hypothetical protein
MSDIVFESFDKIPRLRRGCVVTEKIDGTNAQVYFADDGTMHVGSRNRWITPDNDNYGFARWAFDNEAELRKLGPGRHFGEWWGSGIQRRYGIAEKRFSLFNVGRWSAPDAVLPACVSLVPVLYNGDFSTQAVDDALERLRVGGSVAAPGFMQPEGVVVFHVQSRSLYKVTLGDDGHKEAKTRAA